MQQYWLGLWLGFGYVAMAMAELRLHKANFPFLSYVGGQELRKILFLSFFVGHYILGLTCLFMLTAGWSTSPKSQGLLVMALLILAGGASLKIWSMNSLGRLWSYRCIFIPDMPKSLKGPYRWLRHPEYVARFFEVFGLMIACGTLKVLWPLLLVHFWLIRRMAFCEVQLIEKLQGYEQNLSKNAEQTVLRVDY